ncbi:MAG: hypothetical protein HY908_28035 [Myxococcales bacterium]|nr:hypothetical protein [Myxococcales bacterium]
MATRASRLAPFALAAAAGCGGEAEAPGPTGPQGWYPGVVYPTAREPGARGWLERRGIIHAHSVYSHDACDGSPRDETTGAVNEPCFDTFRRGLCQSRHDFMLLTDHGSTFSSTEYPETLLYRAERGDELVMRAGEPVASFAGCPDGTRALLAAGTETGTMPVGLEHHVAPTEAERDAVYGAETPEAIATLQAAGGVALVSHTEDWSVDQLATLPLDGFEMYNLHANVYTGAGGAFAIAAKLQTPELLPHPDLILLPIVNEDPIYLERWAGVLARGVRRLTVMATDCHANSFPQLLPDGERLDSYRRMMSSFSNHVLVADDGAGGFDDLALKEALRAERLWGAFEMLGYPEGFDFRAELGAAVHEMGETVAPGAELVVELPSVRDLDPTQEPPELTARILRAADGGWEVVAEQPGEGVHYTASAPGAYRAEIRMVPRHLAPYLSSFASLASQSFVWIYANAIYVAAPPP